MQQHAWRVVLTAAVLGLAAAVAQAQTYPSRPVKVIVPFAAGGPLDIVVRGVTDKLSASLKQPFIIENRAGAGGNLGTEAAAKAMPDGYTLLMSLSTALTANPSLYRKLPFEPLTDFRALSILGNSSQMMVVHPSVPVRTLAEFVAYAKKEPLTYAHAGPGSGGHLAMEYFKTVAGFETVQVPYRGNAPLVIDLVAGQVKAGFVATTGVVQHVRDGKLKGLAISPRNARRLHPLCRRWRKPDTPTSRSIPTSSPWRRPACRKRLRNCSSARSGRRSRRRTCRRSYAPRMSRRSVRPRPTRSHA